MEQVFLELGKALLTLGNMLATLVFIRHFWEKGDTISLLLGIVILVGFYYMGSYLISKSEGEASC